jgi:hypothetical protein
MKGRNISIIDFVTDPQLLGLSVSKPQKTLFCSIGEGFQDRLSYRQL